MNTLVVHTGGIGDFLLAFPALDALAREGPVTVAGHSERAALAVAMGLATRAVSMEALDLHTAATAPSARFLDFVAPFDRAMVWMRDDDGALKRAFEKAGCGRVRCAPGLPPANWRGHAADYYLETIGAVAGLRLPPLRLPAVACAWDVLLHPGSGAARKNWPLERYIGLAERFRAEGKRVGWLLGPAEGALPLPRDAERVEEHALTRLGGLLADARQYVGNDSGITHLAATVGCDTTAVFGPTDPAVWAPCGWIVRVVRGEPWPTVDAVWAACGGACYSA